MVSLQKAVIEKFLETLKRDGTFDQSKVAMLEERLKEGKKIKNDDLEAIFTLPDGGEIL